MSTLQEMQIAPGIVDAIDHEKLYWFSIPIDISCKWPEWCFRLRAGDVTIWESEESLRQAYGDIPLNEPPVIATLDVHRTLAKISQTECLVVVDGLGNELARYPL